MTGEPETPWTAPDVERPGGSLVAPEAQRSVVVESGGDPLSLRFVYLHLIGEYARHNGHADLVREHVDGATGA